MIKNKFNFWIGVFCLAGFVINIYNHRDLFTVCLTGVFAIGNIAIGISG